MIVMVFMLSGAVSAASTVTISANGKAIDVNYTFVKSSYHYGQNITHKNGIYGNGYYVTTTVSGKDNTGMAIYIAYNFFNKNLPSIQDNDLKTIYTIEGSGSDKVNLTSTVISSSKMIMSGQGTNSNITVKLNGTSSLKYINGQIIIKNVIATTKLYDHGVYSGVSVATHVYTQGLYDGVYAVIKDTTTTQTYGNGYNRTSVITTVYNRNKDGVLIGQKTAGTSKGSEIINNTIVTYTGVITIGTEYDPNDLIDEKFTTGNYHEVDTSTAKDLMRVVPPEAG